MSATNIELKNARVMYASVCGSHLYGFAGDNSDIDIRGCFIRPLNRYLKINKLTDVIEKTHEVDCQKYDIVLFELEKEIKLMLANNCNVYEHIHAPDVLTSSAEHALFKELAEHLLTKKISNSYVGLAKHNYMKYIAPFYPNEIDCVPAKKFLYVLRALMACDYVLSTGNLESNIFKLNEVYGYNFIEGLVGEKNDGVKTVNKLDVTKSITLLFDRVKDHESCNVLPDGLTEAKIRMADTLYYYLRTTMS
jgi:hypothetical protein